MTIDFSPGEKITVVPVGIPVDLDNPGFFGVRNGAFEINDMEGTQCRPPFSATNGMNDSRAFVLSEPAVKNYCDVSIQLNIRLSNADFEPCLNRTGVNPVGCTDFLGTGPGGDGVTVEVRIGNSIIMKGGYCGDQMVGQFSINNLNIKIGDIMALLITGGTQAPEESYYIDQILVKGKESSFTGAILNASKTELCAGREVLIINEVTNGSSYQWEKDGVVLPEMGNNITRSPVMLQDAGRYTVTMVEMGGCTSTKSIDIAVDECEMIPVFSFDPFFCQSDSLRLSNTSDNQVSGNWSYNNISLADTVGEVILQFSTGTGSFPYLINVFPTYYDTIYAPICLGEEISINGIVFSLAGQLSGADTLTSVDGCDSIVFIQLIPLVVVDTIGGDELLCSDEERLINGNIYNKNNPNGVDTLISNDGCDTILIIDLQYVVTDTIESTVDLCLGDSAIIFGNTVYPFMGDQEFFIGPNGCDTLVILRVEVIEPLIQRILINLCADQDTMIGDIRFDPIINNTGEARLKASNGCDSILIIDILLIEDKLTFLDSTICRSDTVTVGPEKFYWSKASGEVRFSSSMGCDSTVTVQLAFYQNGVTTISKQYCEGDTVEINGELFYEGRSEAVQILESKDGCDSLIEIKLEFLPRYVTDIGEGELLCSDDTRVVNGITYNISYASGVDTLSSISGCDSILIINFQFITPDTVVQTIQICRGDTIDYAGLRITEEMDGNGILIGQNQCDTFLFFDLLILDIDTTTIQIALCQGTDTLIGGLRFDPFDIPSGLVHLSSTFGCDSILKVVVVPLADTTYLFSQAICPKDSIEIGGLVFNEMNPEGLIRLQRQNGCDSIINVKLEIYRTDTNEINSILCPGDFLMINSQRYDILNPSGVEISTNVHGCDSLLFINLTFNDFINITIDTAICMGETIEIAGQIFDSRQGSDTILIENNAGCDSLIIVNTTMAPSPQVQAINDTIDCSNDGKVRLMAFTDDVITQWSGPNNIVSFSPQPEVQMPGTYIVSVANSFGCISYDTATISIDLRAPQISLQFAEEVTCQSAGAFIESQSDGEIISWIDPEGDKLSNTTTQTVFNPGIYQVIAQGDNACIDTGFIEVRFNEPFITLTSIENTCNELANGSIMISAVSDLGLPFLLSGISETDLQIEVVPYTIDGLGSGDYFIIAEDSRGCIAQSSFNIGDQRNDDLIISAVSITDGQFQLTLNSTSTIVQIIWSDFPGLSCNDCANPVVSISEPIELFVEVMDSDGCILSDRIFLSVEIRSGVYLPNIFNPNSSVGNGRFYPQGNYPSPIFFELEIYDRWGNILYSQKGFEVGDTNSGWDGSSRNQSVNSGMYSYLLNLYDETGQIVDVLKGSVTLIR